MPLAEAASRLQNAVSRRSGEEFYRLTRSLKLSAGLKDQLNRAASSIALNLAEGRAKSTLPDQLKFFNIAFGSLRESQAILILSSLEGTEAWQTLDRLAAQLYCLTKNAKGG